MSLINLNEDTFYLLNLSTKRKRNRTLIPKLYNRLFDYFDFNNQHQQKQQLLQNLQQSVDFINNQFTNHDNSPIEIRIDPMVNEGIDYDTNRGKIIENNNDHAGAFFTSGCITHNPYIVLSAKCITGQEHIGQEELDLWVKSMIENQGQNDFAKMLLYHETGHYLDYLLSNNLLNDTCQNNTIISPGFLKQHDSLFQDFLNSWNKRSSIKRSDDEEKDINSLFQSILKESVADCWSCACLFREKLDSGLINQNNQKKAQKKFSKIIDSLIESRKLTHQNDPASGYATYNALTRLNVNYKNQKPKTNQDWVDMIQQSTQEGLVLNLKSIVNSPKTKHEDIADKIRTYKTKNDNDLNQRLDQYKIG